MNLLSLKNKIKFYYILVLIIVISTSCQKQDYDKTSNQSTISSEEKSASGQSIQDDKSGTPILPDKLMGSTVSRITSLDSTKKLLRKADIKFKVENVYDASLKAESIVREFNGFVQSSRLNNQIYNTEQISISRDSFVKITTYVLENNMILRVPAQNLDSTLIKVGRMMTFLNHRHVEVRDITLDFLTKELAEKRNKNLQKRLQLQTDKKDQAKLEDAVNAEIQSSMAEEKADEAKIEQYRMADSLKYSFIQLSIYQNENRWAETMPNPKGFDHYKPSIFSRAWDAISFGFEGLMNFIIELLRIWPFFIVVSILVYVFLKFYKNKN